MFTLSLHGDVAVLSSPLRHGLENNTKTSILNSEALSVIVSLQEKQNYWESLLQTLSNDHYCYRSES